MGLALSVSGFGFQESRYRFLGLCPCMVYRCAFDFRNPSSTIRDSGCGIRDSGVGESDSGIGIRVKGFGIRDSGFGFRVQEFGYMDAGFGSISHIVLIKWF